MFDSLRLHALWPARLLCPWNFPGKNTGVGCHFLCQGIFPTQDRTWVSGIAGRFFTIWATREALHHWTIRESPKSADWLMPQILSTRCLLGPVPAVDYGPYSQGTPGLGLSLIFRSKSSSQNQKGLRQHQPIPLCSWGNWDPERESNMFKTTQGVNVFSALKPAEESQCFSREQGCIQKF